MNWNTDLIKKDIPKKTEKLNNIEVRLFNIISKNDGPVKVNKINYLAVYLLKKPKPFSFSRIKRFN